MDSKLIELALEIADEQSTSIIECEGIPDRSTDGKLLWYVMNPEDKDSGFYQYRAMRYLEMRGKLRRRKSNGLHVKAVR